MGKQRHVKEFRIVILATAGFSVRNRFVFLFQVTFLCLIVRESRVRCTGRGYQDLAVGEVSFLLIGPRYTISPVRAPVVMAVLTGVGIVPRSIS